MEMQQRPQSPRAAATPDAGDSSGVSQTLEACRKLADAADAAIDQAYSGNAEMFIAANQQKGGQ